MRNLLLILFGVALSGATFAQEQAGNGQEKIFSITASPAEQTHNGMNFSWATDTSIKDVVLEIARTDDFKWKRAVSATCSGIFCTTYDSVYSKTADSKDFYEDVKINKYNKYVGKLKKETNYKYRIIAGNDTTATHYFNTGKGKEWSACIISDFHVYSPLYGRTKAAMEMINTVEEYDMPFEWILHLGDITAWGGSYSFWKNLYKEEPFIKYMWAGVNGNHDNMTRGYHRTTNEFFRDAAAYPHNGYGDEIGVCYWFKYGDALFIMLNNESMKSEEGLKEAQEWVRKVVAENPSKYKIVCEHYQWFYGESGKNSQYERWYKLFDELGIDLALGANNHIYVSTHPLYADKVAEPGKGTVYIQTPSSDNERGVECDLEKPLEYNSDKIKFRWSEGGKTVGAIHMKVNRKKMTLTLLDRNGKVLDVTEVLPKK